jgi:hypothetical protein
VAQDGIRLLVDLLDKEIDSVVGNAALTLALLAQEPRVSGADIIFFAFAFPCLCPHLFFDWRTISPSIISPQ